MAAAGGIDRGNAAASLPCGRGPFGTDAAGSGVEVVGAGPGGGITALLPDPFRYITGRRGVVGIHGGVPVTARCIAELRAADGHVVWSGGQPVDGRPAAGWLGNVRARAAIGG